MHQPELMKCIRPLGFLSLGCRRIGLMSCRIDAGHFTLGPVLGEGHTGMVFKAKDLKSLRTVALRVLPSEFPKNDAERQRFVQAVKEMLHLDHVNLVKLYGAGKADGYHWLATEFVEGPSLSQIMKQGRPTPVNGEETIRAWEPAYRVAVHIARALDYATSINLSIGTSRRPISWWPSRETTARKRP